MASSTIALKESSSSQNNEAMFSSSVALKESSQDMQHSRGRQPQTLGHAQPRHRSESRRLSDRRRKVKTAARKQNYCPGALQKGDAILVFSRSAAAWMDGEVVKFFEGNFVLVEYEVDEYWHGKTLHLHSERLDIPRNLPASPSNYSLTSSTEEVDPGCWNFEDMLKHKDIWAQDSVVCSLEVLAQKGSQKAQIELFAMASSGSADAHAALERLGNGVVPEVSRPDFLKAQVTSNMKTLQCTEPTKWAMTLNQWNAIVEECMSSYLFQEIKHSKKSFEQFVSVYDINEYFVKPWTRGKGCGLALLMNPDGKDAQIMLSHAWGEDIKELYQALNKHFESQGIDKDKAVWFCTFAQYQVQDGAGPDIQTQLHLNPFTTVIQSKQVETMLAAHTTRADLWERLWCVREVREAMTEKISIEAAFSDDFVNHFKETYNTMIEEGYTHQDGMEAAGMTVRTSRATCRNEDKAMLLRELKKHGSINDIDGTTTALRTSLVHPIVLEVAGGVADKGKPQALLQLTNQGDLEAVDLLYEVAENGNEQARNALCEALMPKRYGVIQDQRDREAVQELVNALLLAMVSSGHQKSFDALAENPCRRHLTHGRWHQTDKESRLALLSLAKQGDPNIRQRALEQFVSWASTESDADILVRNDGRIALESLVEHWDRQALKAVKAMAKQDSIGTWAQKTLERCRRQLKHF